MNVALCDVSVRVYECSEMAVNCGRCRAVDQRYGCGWCLGARACSIQQRCTGDSWISRSQLCPDPVVTQVVIAALYHAVHVH